MRSSRTRRSGAARSLGLAAALFALICLAATPTATGGDHSPIRSAKLSQAGRSLIVQVTTDRQVALRDLNRQPDFRSDGARYLCLNIGRASGGVISRICLGGRHNPHHRVGVSRTAANGRVFSRDTIPARLKRKGRYGLVVTFEPGSARLTPDSYRWQVSLADGSCPVKAEGVECAATWPARHRRAYRLLPVRAVGCSGGNGQLVLHGPRRGKRVALTFDDGPSLYTPDVLRVLRRFKARATFFMLGMQVGIYPDLARKVLAGGHEIANHSSIHTLLPGYTDIARASRTIRRATGFRPCLFRPPYGATSGSLIDSVRRAKMKTVIWDVDTTDWRLPGSGSIRSTITGRVRPGSIVLMHDGGGPRSQTVDALPGAIRTLRRRGYRLVTVSELLGNRTIYRPVGRN